MVRFIVQLLIVSLLTLNIAWAVDECAFTDPGQTNSVFQIDDSSPDTPNGGLGCDDWCHAWVNPIGLTGSSILDVYILATFSGGACILSYSSLSISPPFHPPIA